MQCEFAGCKAEARWIAHKLWGKGGTIHTCTDHRPGSKKRPGMPFFYRVESLTHRCTKCNSVLQFFPEGTWETAEHGVFCPKCGPRGYDS